MLGISYGELFLILGATAALIGPKDLPIIARTAGRFFGRAVGYVQLARGQFDSVMQQSQARQVHKELQDTMAQLEAIRHEVRSLSFMNPGLVSTRLVDNVVRQPHAANAEEEHLKPPEDKSVKVEATESTTTTKDHSPMPSTPLNVHSQAIAYDKLAESTAPISNVINEVLSELKDDSGQFIVLPISAESAKLLPSRTDDLKGSDIMLEVLLEEDVAHKSKDFFSHAQNQRTSNDK